MKSKLSFFILLFVTLLSSSPLFADVNVTASVNDTQVVKGDIFILTINVNDKDSDYQLDTRPLEKLFTVYRPSQSQSTQYINGEFNQQTEWKVRLQALETGTLTIPSLKIGDLNTEAIEINVVEASQRSPAANDQDRSVFMENSIDKQDVFVGQSFIFTTKLYISKTVMISTLPPQILKALKQQYLVKTVITKSYVMEFVTIPLPANIK